MRWLIIQRRQVTCYAESTDGIHFVRPNLGLHEIDGSKENNVILSGVASHNFAPFLDTNPAAKPDERYKAVAGLQSNLFAFGSPDGIHWKKLQPEPVMTKGTFDSLNLAFWDDVRMLPRLLALLRSAARTTAFGPSKAVSRRIFCIGTDPATESLRRGRAEGTFLHQCDGAVPWRAASVLVVSDAIRSERKKITEHEGTGRFRCGYS